MLTISENLKKTYPGGYIGVLALSNVKSYEGCIALDKEKKCLEEMLRAKYMNCDRSKLKSTAPIDTYVDYYNKFKKTYHVLLQLESIIFKNKTIPKVNALVEVMFMAELKNQLLTAGHDLDAMSLPMRAELTTGKERFTTISGQEKELTAGDMMITDGQGIISNITYGPDQRTQISKDTERVVYTVYAPPGIRRTLVQEHFKDIIRYSMLVSPESKVELEEIYSI